MTARACPFCTDTAIRMDVLSVAGTYHVAMTCAMCGARGPAVRAVGTYTTVYQNAVNRIHAEEAWNQRGEENE